MVPQSWGAHILQENRILSHRKMVDYAYFLLKFMYLFMFIPIYQSCGWLFFLFFGSSKNWVTDSLAETSKIQKTFQFAATAWTWIWSPKPPLKRSAPLFRPCHSENDSRNLVPQIGVQKIATFSWDNNRKENPRRPMNCYMESEDDELLGTVSARAEFQTTFCWSARKILSWTLADHGGIAYFGFAYYLQQLGQKKRIKGHQKASRQIGTSHMAHHILITFRRNMMSYFVWLLARRIAFLDSGRIEFVAATPWIVIVLHVWASWLFWCWIWMDLSYSYRRWVSSYFFQTKDVPRCHR